MPILTVSEAIEARTQQNLSQAKVASDTGLNRNYISQFESGKRILDDNQLQELREYYESQGWEREASDPGVDVETIDQMPEPMHSIRDGFVICSHISEEEIDLLMTEYHENAELIRKLSANKSKNGIFGGIETEANVIASIDILMLIARQQSIISALHGCTDIESDEFSVSSKEVQTMGDYVNYIIGDRLSEEDGDNPNSERLKFPLFT